jgi:hypothetical protein
LFLAAVANAFGYWRRGAALPFLSGVGRQRLRLLPPTRPITRPNCSLAIFDRYRIEAALD